MLKLNVRSSATADLNEALAYYAEVAPELPDTFLEQLSIALTLVREHPNVGSRRFAHLFPGIDLRTWSKAIPCTCCGSITNGETSRPRPLARSGARKEGGQQVDDGVYLS